MNEAGQRALLSNSRFITLAPVPFTVEITVSGLLRAERFRQNALARQDWRAGTEKRKVAEMGLALSKQELTAGLVSEAACSRPSLRQLLVLVVEDTPTLSRAIGFLCDYLGMTIQSVPSDADLASLLRSKNPMAVMSAVDARWQDGCHVLKTVAEYDRSLPVLLVTGRDPTLLGAVEAVEELWQLGQVLKMTSIPGIGDLVEFLFRAGRRTGSSLLPT